jgi:hypothetical protein
MPAARLVRGRRRTYRLLIDHDVTIDGLEASTQ